MLFHHGPLTKKKKKKRVLLLGLPLYMMIFVALGTKDNAGVKILGNIIN